MAGSTPRVTLGSVFGLSLLGAGQWIVKREHIANSLRIAQGLVGAGLVTLYACLYAATNLYHLLPPLFGFGGMTVVTALAVILSLRHGQPIAVFGLLGGLLTPALIGSDEPNAIILFTYLFLLFSGMFIILARKGWWVLATIALIGVFFWSGFWYWFVFTATDAFVLVFFAVSVTAVVLAVTGRRVAETKENDTRLAENLPIHALNFTAITGGVLTIIWLSVKISLTLFDWSMLGLFTLALVGLSYFQPSIYQRILWIKLGADLILFLIWAQTAPLSNAIAVIVGMTAIYALIPAFLMRNVRDPRFWAGIQAVGAVALYVVSYFALDLPVWFTDPFARFWGILSLILASLATYQAWDIKAKYQADETIRDHLVAIYALVASAFISLGLAIECPWEYLPLAFAGQIAVTAWIYHQTGIAFMQNILMILSLIFVAMNYEQILLFGDLALESLFGDTATLDHYALDIPLIKLGIPAALFALTSWLYLKEGEKISRLGHVLFGTALALTLATSYYLVRDLFNDTERNPFLTQAGFIERGAISIAIALIGIAVMKLVERYDLPFLQIWGKALFHLAMLRIGYFDILIHNPYFSSGQLVGEWPVINGVTMTYGTGILLAAWAVYSRQWLVQTHFYKLLGFVLLFTFVSLTVRQYFHGNGLAVGAMGSGEFYAYSVAWLVTGLGLLTVGIMKQNKTVRIASLVFMLLTIGKVFLFDAAELEGLYRVFSFLGLGLSLIGLSYFYTKFVFGVEQQEEKEKE